MRVLFLLLLLANLLFLAWTRWVDQPEPATRAAVTATARLQPIRLQREQPDAGAVAATAAAGQSATASCVSLGPFVTPAHADLARLQLERLGYTSRRRVAQDEVRVGYWVHVPNLATPVDAANALAALQTAGLADASIIDDDGPGATVSVGVYADPRKAAEVAAVVQKAGFTPETSDRLRTLEVLWLDIDGRANGGLPSVDDLGPPPDGALPYDQRACPAASGVADVTPPANP